MLVLRARPVGLTLACGHPSMPSMDAVPPAPLPARYRVLLQGFGGFERLALESYFRLAASHAPAFEPAASLADCDYCVVDADSPPAVAAVCAAGRLAASVFVGRDAPDGAALHLPRPIDALKVARALESLVAAAAHPEAPTVAAAPPAEPDLDLFAAVASGPGLDLDVLVVDDSDIARRFLAVQLQRLGCRVTQAGSTDEALALVAARRFRIVFSDVVMAEPDGLALCHEIKQRGAADAPVVVLVSARCSPTDRVRGTLAGCDAYLGKPLPNGALQEVLRLHGGLDRRGAAP